MAQREDSKIKVAISPKILIFFMICSSLICEKSETCAIQNLRARNDDVTGITLSTQIFQ